MEPNKAKSFFRNSSKYWLAGTIAVVVLIVAGLLAFGGDKAVRTNNASQSANTQTTTEKPSDNSSDEALARSITPCELLSAQERAKFSLAAGEADNKHIRGCDWENSGVLYTHASVYPLYGLDKFDRDDATSKPITIGSHQARLVEPRQNSPLYGTCQVVIALGTHQSASVVVTANGAFSRTPDQAKYCGIVQQLAGFIEARLPVAD